MMKLIMKYNLRHILMALMLAVCSLHCAADESAPKDTIYFYDTWQQMLDNQPESMLVNPIIDVFSPYSITFSAYNEKVSKEIRTKHIAISMGDSIWLVNSYYLNKYFTSDAEYLMGYVPVFFNDKVAYIIYHSHLHINDLQNDMSDRKHYDIDYFYIDFLNHKIGRVTPTYLSQLLEDYNDLKMRYEGMKDYKKREIIEEFFLKYVDRATEDIMRPYILDLVSDKGM